MTIYITQQNEESLSDADNSPQDANYHILTTAAESKAAVLAALQGTTPAVSGMQKVHRVVRSRENKAYWTGSVQYVPWKFEKFKTSETTWEFEAGGGSRHLKYSLATIATYPTPSGSPAWPPDTGQGIDADEMGTIKGVDVPGGCGAIIKAVKFVAYASLNDTLIGTYCNLAGCMPVNNATFHGFAAGEVLFAGVRGGSRGKTDYELAFEFRINKNVTGEAVGSITGIAREGWDYAWARYAPSPSGNDYALVPLFVKVERVHPRMDFSVLGV